MTEPRQFFRRKHDLGPTQPSETGVQQCESAQRTGYGYRATRRRAAGQEGQRFGGSAGRIIDRTGPSPGQARRHGIRDGQSKIERRGRVGGTAAASKYRFRN